jgi:serine/threonine protein phosphatase 1
MNKEYRRLYAIPDLHGRSDLLDLGLKLMAEDGYDKELDLIILLGDYIDRGRDSKGVLDRIIALVEAGDAKAISGNHEDFAIGTYVRNDSNAKANWNTMGCTRL